jgi:hypothetical protein
LSRRKLIAVVVMRTRADAARDALPGIFLAACVAVVLLGWCAALLFFGLRFI